MTLWISWIKIHLIIAFPIAYSKVSYEWNQPANITYEECKTTVCEEQAKDILACMNQHANPCDDFFEYVCGKWPQQHNNPDRQYRGFPWNIESVIEYKAYLNMRSILEQPINPHEDEDKKKAKMFYKTCMNLPWMGKMNAADLKPIVANAGPWPMFPLKSNINELYLDWVSIHNYYLKLTGESALFGIAIRSNPQNKLPTLEIRKCTSPYGMFTRLVSWTLKESSDYATFLSTIANDVKPPNTIDISSDKFQKHIENVIDFRSKLQKVINGLNKQGQTVMTIDYLNSWYNDKFAIHSKIAEIPWLRVIKTLYENDTSDEINKKTVILLSYSTYFTELRSILSKSTSRTIINHIHLYFIERHLYLTREQQDLLYASRSLVPTEPVSKNRVLHEKWYSCIEKHSSQSVLGKIYIQNNPSLMNTEHVKKMIKEIKDMVMVQINDATWMDEETKSVTKLKIDKIKTSLGYPKWYYQPTKYKNECVNIYPFRPEAKYCIEKNKMYITAAYFHPPLYDKSLPFNMNYAALGALIGHEIYHSVDSRAICFDPKGKKSTWWPSNMFSTFNFKRECFQRQYSHYKVKEFRGYRDAPTKPYSFTTIEEDISDTMGLKVAYEAYRLKLLQKYHVCKSLPHLSNYSCDQLFFISFARTFCFAATPRQMMFTARYDEHHTPRIRVNGAVANLKEFSDAFQCAANAPLNPRQRCDLWE